MIRASAILRWPSVRRICASSIAPYQRVGGTRTCATVLGTCWEPRMALLAREGEAQERLVAPAPGVVAPEAQPLVGGRRPDGQGDADGLGEGRRAVVVGKRDSRV